MNDTALVSPHPAAALRHIERGALIAFAFVLPLVEAPKNILWVVFVAIWVLNRWRTRDLGGPWDYWDTLIALWIGSGFAAAAFAGIRGDEWHAAADIVRYATVLWILKRSHYADRTWVALIAAILAGTIAGLAWGYYGLLMTKENYLTLNSVGHVNHSSIYLAIAVGVALAAMRAWWQEFSVLRRMADLALLAFLVVALFWMQSRAAVGAAFIVAFAILSAHAARRRKGLGLVALAVAAAVVATLLISPQVVEKNRVFMQKSYMLNGRDEIWRVGLRAWREFPLFGVGMGNFGRVDYKQLESWSAKRGEVFERQSFLPAAHGHSLYITALAERGLVGLGILLAVLAAWALALVRRIPDANAPPLAWAFWGSAASGWIITIVVGAMNTTLHHEEALLCMLLFGGWLSLSGAPQQPKRKAA
jgi:O-antigen ligase